MSTHIDPVFAVPGAEYVETPDGRPLCCMVLCCAKGAVRVPGLPAGSVPLDARTRQRVLDGWQGSWRVTAPDPDILNELGYNKHTQKPRVLTEVLFAVRDETRPKGAPFGFRAGIGYKPDGKPVAVDRASYTMATFDLDGNVALSGGQHIIRWENSLVVGIDNSVPFKIINGRHGAKNRMQAVMEPNEGVSRDAFSNENHLNLRKHTTTFVAPDGTIFLDSWGVRSVTLIGEDKLRWRTRPESPHCCCCWHPGPHRGNASLLERVKEKELDVGGGSGVPAVAAVATVAEDVGDGVVSPIHGLASSEGVAMEVMQREDFSETLRKLKSLLDEGVLSQEEFDAKKAEVLKSVC